MIYFEKWHGNGNDFAIINSIENKIKLNKSFIKKTSNRNKGIGFDQLIHIGLPSKHDHDFFIRFYNSDGSEAGMCLNGVRCAARYIWNNNLFPIRQLKIQTKRKNLICSPKDKNNVSVLVDSPEEMQVPALEHKKIKKVMSDDFFLSFIGNNHLCVQKKSIDKVNLEDLYEKIGWPLYKKYGHAFDAFKLSISEEKDIEDPFKDLDIPQDLKDELKTYILRRLSYRRNPSTRINAVSI